MIPMLVNTYEMVKTVKGHVAHFRNIAFIQMQRNIRVGVALKYLLRID